MVISNKLHPSSFIKVASYYFWIGFILNKVLGFLALTKLNKQNKLPPWWGSSSSVKFYSSSPGVLFSPVTNLVPTQFLKDAYLHLQNIESILCWRPGCPGTSLSSLQIYEKITQITWCP